jgi:hypothetical protein
MLGVRDLQQYHHRVALRASARLFRSDLILRRSVDARIGNLGPNLHVVASRAVGLTDIVGAVSRPSLADPDIWGSTSPSPPPTPWHHDLPLRDP